ncbi:MAG TPA: hypothetical protein VK154_20450 [Chitinophagales bacterium]|nr:hypothetical protein [Chitinophagales bacterium]
MRSIKHIALLLLIILSINGCNSNKQQNQSTGITEISFTDTAGTLLSKGHLTPDSVQTGYWEFYYDRKISEQGSFTDGRPYGRWSYNLQSFKEVIDWDTATVLGSLKISYPNNFYHTQDHSVFNLVSSDSAFEITVTSEPLDQNIEILKLKSEKIIAADSFTITKTTCAKVLCNNNQSYVLFYDIHKEGLSGLDYNVFIPTGARHFKIRMHSKSFDQNQYQYLMTVYLSITRNLFVGKLKLLDINKLRESDC